MPGARRSSASSLRRPPAPVVNAQDNVHSSRARDRARALIMARMSEDEDHARADATFGGCGNPECPTGDLEANPDWPLPRRTTPGGDPAENPPAPALIATLQLDRQTLRDALDDADGLLAYGIGGDGDDLLVVEFPLARYRALGEPDQLTITIRAR